MSDCVLLGDRGYLSSTIQLDLFETANIKLETPMRIKLTIKSNHMFLENQENALRLYSLNCATNL